jgi:type II secretory pathway component PulF
MIEAWEMAAAASGSPVLQRIIRRYKPELAAGRTPSEMVSAHREFPRAFASLYHTGEISGTLDDALRRSHALFEDEGSRRMKQFIFGLAGVLVGAIMLMVAWSVVAFYVDLYGRQLNDAINFNGP